MKSKAGQIAAIIASTITGLIIVIVALSTAIVMNKNEEDNQYRESSRDYRNDFSYTSGSAEYGYSTNMGYEVEKVITKNRIHIETKNIAKTVSSLEELIQTYEGKIVSKNVDLGDSRYGSIVVKIPSDKGNEFVNKINDDYNVSSYATEVSDVTEQYVNVEKEIQNLQRKIALYEELAEQTSIKDIETRIHIIDRIFALERQIEYLQEQNQDIDKKVEYRDVVITLSAPEKIQGERNYWHNTVQMIVSTLQGSFRVLLLVITMSLPFGIFIGLPIVGYRKMRKKQ